MASNASKDTAKTELKIREPSDFVYGANLEALDPGMGQFLETIEEKTIAVDENVKLQGLNNPLYLVLIGFTSDTILRACLQQKDKDVHYVLVIEPDVGVFKQTLRRYYIADLLENKKIDFIVGVPQDQLPHHVKATFSIANDKEGARAAKCQNPEVLVDPFAFPPMPNGQNPIAQDCISAVMEAAKNVFTSMGCASDSHWRWIQSVRNFENMQSSWNIKPLFNQFNETPVVVIGGGPSSETFIKNYKENDELKKFFLISCDAMLPRLLKEGIKPHIVTRCERKYTTIFGDTKKEDTKGIYYAAYTWTPPEFFNLFHDSFILFRDNGVNKWTEYNHGAVNGGVSSANAALELAYLLGFKKIILTGIDLCFIDDKSHAAGTQVEFDLSKSEKKWSKHLCNDGEERTSIPVWLRCKFEYEGGFQKHKDLNAEIINTSDKGLRLVGAEYKKWDDLLSGQYQKVDWHKKIKSLREKPSQEMKDRLESKKVESIAFLKELKDALDKLFSFTDDCMLTAKREEQRLCQQLKAHYDPTEIFNNAEAVKKSLSEVYREPCRQIDNFKVKYYGNKIFWHILLDTCQLDFYHAENRMYAIKNLVKLEHERMKSYVAVHTLLFRCIYYYTTRMIKLLTDGPDPKDIQYTPETEIVGIVPVDTKLMDEIDAVIDRCLSSQKRSDEAPRILAPHVVKQMQNQFKAYKNVNR